MKRHANQWLDGWPFLAFGILLLVVLAATCGRLW